MGVEVPEDSVLPGSETPLLKLFPFTRCPKESRESFENPMASLVAQKWKVQDFCDINPFLEGLMKEFQGKDNGLQGYHPVHYRGEDMDGKGLRSPLAELEGAMEVSLS